MIRLRIPKIDDRKIVKLIKEELVPISRKTFPNLKFEPKQMYYRLKKGVTFVVTTNKWKIKGFIHIFISQKTLWIDMMALKSDFRGKGWGRALMEKSEHWGRKSGCNRVNLYVDKPNSNAQRFYRYLGFQSIHYDPNLNCYLYSKSL